MDAGGERRAAWISGVALYLIWGFLPLAMQAMAQAGAGAWEILAHRVIWGALLAGVFVMAARHGGQVRRALTEPKTLALLFFSSGLIAANWATFIWAVNSGRVIQTSLGYFIIPLVNIAAGALIFRESISRLAMVAIALAGVGVILQGVALGRLPWVSLVLAVTFGAYGVVRKKISIDAQGGLFLECLLLSLPSLAFIAWLQATGQASFFTGLEVSLWLIAAGPLTAVPLALFSWTARRLPLSAFGFLQFLGPTIGFFIGLYQGEPFGAVHAASFAFIWAGAAVFIANLAVGARKARALAPPLAATEKALP